MHQHVDEVDDVEADHLPQLDLLVEEHEDEIHRGHLRLRRILSIPMEVMISRKKDSGFTRHSLMKATTPVMTVVMNRPAPRFEPIPMWV